MANLETITGGREKPDPDELDLEGRIGLVYRLALTLRSLADSDAGASKEDINDAQDDLIDAVFREAKALRDTFRGVGPARES
jgi:hypothetical protein